MARTNTTAHGAYLKLRLEAVDAGVSLLTAANTVISQRR
jgi:AmiR/NasT family two-component response regulator